MSQSSTDTFQVTAWSGSQHPSLSNVTKLLKSQNLRPYSWDKTPNHRYLISTHTYKKVLYVIEGSLEITFPEGNKIVKMKSGDRIDINANVRHSITVGKNGVTCVEAALSNS
jgi:mannose-6-phosphate isomerase-like protein (cupin superfamily)